MGETFIVFIVFVLLNITFFYMFCLERWYSPNGQLDTTERDENKSLNESNYFGDDTLPFKNGYIINSLVHCYSEVSIE